MKAIAIDDEPLAIEVLRAHAEKVPYLNLKAGFTDAFKALDFLQNQHTDLIFLDIKMPDISGIDFYNSLGHKPLLIFTTAYEEHAVTGFEMDAVDYLLKPISLSRFIKACNKAYELHNLRNSDETTNHLYIKSGYEHVKILYHDILYLEGAGNYIAFVLKERKILSRITFSEAEDLLPPGEFIRVHRSYIVPVNKIDKVERDQLNIGKKNIPLSAAYRAKIRAIFDPN